MKTEKYRVSSDIDLHFFVCTNERTSKNKSCGKNGSLPLYKYLKERMKKISENFDIRVKVNSSGCLSNCSNGPVVVCYPQGDWYSIKSYKDIDVLIVSMEQNLIKGSMPIKKTAMNE